MAEDEGTPTPTSWLRWYADQPEHSEILLAFWAPDGDLLAVNRLARQLLGWGEGVGVDGHRFGELVAKGSLTTLVEASREANARGQWRGELALAFEGVRVRGELTLRSDLPGCGPTLCLQCRKLARQPAAPGTPPWLAQHYERLVRLSPALAVVANTTHYELVSPAWEKVLGYSEEEMLQRPYTDFVLPEDIPLTVACVVSLIEGGQLIESFENRFIRRDGAILSLAWSAIYDPDMQRLYAVAYDVTEQRALQARLHEASKAAEQASRAKSQFLANTSHEIRTPLNAILNANELLLTSALDDEQRELVEIALLAGRGLQGLLSNVLDLSRIESGRLELEQSAFDPRRPLDEVLRAQRNRALDQGLDLELHVSPDLPLRIVGDELRLRQIVGNLVDNALKFTTRGCVSVHVGTVRGDLWLCVRDTGVGIAPEKLGHIFEPFTQADVSDTRRHGGAGLGLTICHEFITRMGGSIRVDSRPGVGTTFEVQLPMVVPPAQPPSDPRLQAAAEVTQRPLRVLVAEDNAFNARVLSKWLHKQGHTVVVVADGVEACEQGCQGTWDIVLMDLQMPRRDGFEATRMLRRVCGTDLPIVALTASAQQGEAERCRAAGMDDYLTKPVSFERLDRLLRSIAGS